MQKCPTISVSELTSGIYPGRKLYSFPHGPALQDQPGQKLVELSLIDHRAHQSAHVHALPLAAE